MPYLEHTQNTNQHYKDEKQEIIGHRVVSKMEHFITRYHAAGATVNTLYEVFTKINQILHHCLF